MTAEVTVAVGRRHGYAGIVAPTPSIFKVLPGTLIDGLLILESGPRSSLAPIWPRPVTKVYEYVSNILCIVIITSVESERKYKSACEAIGFGSKAIPRIRPIIFCPNPEIVTRLDNTSYVPLVMYMRISIGPNRWPLKRATMYTKFWIFVPRWDQAKIDHKTKMTLLPK